MLHIMKCSSQPTVCICSDDVSKSGGGRTEQVVEADEVSSAIGRPAPLGRRVLLGRLGRRVGAVRAARTEPPWLLGQRRVRDLRRAHRTASPHESEKNNPAYCNSMSLHAIDAIAARRMQGPVAGKRLASWCASPEDTGTTRCAAAHLLQRRLQAVDVVPVIAARAAQQVLPVVVAPAHAAVVPGRETPAHTRSVSHEPRLLYKIPSGCVARHERTRVVAEDSRGTYRSSD